MVSDEVLDELKECFEVLMVSEKRSSRRLKESWRF